MSLKNQLWSAVWYIPVWCLKETVWETSCVMSLRNPLCDEFEEPVWGIICVMSLRNQLCDVLRNQFDVVRKSLKATYTQNTLWSSIWFLEEGLKGKHPHIRHCGFQIAPLRNILKVTPTQKTQWSFIWFHVKDTKYHIYTEYSVIICFMS